LANGYHKKYNPLGPNALHVPINEVPVLSMCEDQFISLIDNKVAEQSSEKKQQCKWYYVKNSY